MQYTPCMSPAFAKNRVVSICLLHLFVWIFLSNNLTVFTSSTQMSTKEDEMTMSKSLSLVSVKSVSEVFRCGFSPPPYRQNDNRTWGLSQNTRSVLFPPHAQMLGAWCFPRHSLASRAATHVHTCNPAAVENTVASTVVHKLLPHCEHVIYYTVIFLKAR